MGRPRGRRQKLRDEDTEERKGRVLAAEAAGAAVAVAASAAAFAPASREISPSAREAPEPAEGIEDVLRVVAPQSVTMADATGCGPGGGGGGGVDGRKRARLSEDRACGGGTRLFHDSGDEDAWGTSDDFEAGGAEKSFARIGNRLFLDNDADSDHGEGGGCASPFGLEPVAVGAAAGGAPAENWTSSAVAPFRFPDESCDAALAHVPMCGSQHTQGAVGLDLPSLRIVTYNVWMERVTTERVAAVVDALRRANADVIALQELTHGMLRRMRYEQPEFWASYPHRLLQPPAEKMTDWEPDYFVGLLSRWPLQVPVPERRPGASQDGENAAAPRAGSGQGGSCATQSAPEEGGQYLEFRSRMDRGLLCARVHPPSMRHSILVGTSHFESVHSGDTCWALRREQLRRSVWLLREANAEASSGAAVLLGDFNWVTPAPDMRIVLADADAGLGAAVNGTGVHEAGAGSALALAPWIDAWLQAGGTDADGVTFDPSRNALIGRSQMHLPAQRLDRVLVARGACCVGVSKAELIGLPEGQGGDPIQAGQAEAGNESREVYTTPLTSPLSPQDASQRAAGADERDSCGDGVGYAHVEPRTPIGDVSTPPAEGDDEDGMNTPPTMTGTAQGTSGGYACPMSVVRGEAPSDHFGVAVDLTIGPPVA